MGIAPADSKLLQVHLGLRPTSMGLFRSILPDTVVAGYCRRHQLKYRNRFFTPTLTLWTFIAQCLDPDHSCRSAVARALDWWRRRRAPGQRRDRPVGEHSHDTGAYCRARERLPEHLISSMSRHVAAKLDDCVPQADKPWKRDVYLVDATCVSMPDTADLVEEFGRSGGGKNGSKQSLFPLARLVAIVSLATGAVVDAATGAYRTSERSLFRTLLRSFPHLRDAIFVGDALYGSLPNLAWLKAHGADIITRPYARRKIDMRHGKVLGPGDRLVVWKHDPKLDPLAEDDIQGEDLTVRLIEVRSLLRGFRPKRMVLVTTLTDPDAYSTEDIANLYLRRWEIEVDLRHLKSVMGMEVLRGKTPDIVRKEIWAHLTTYNLVRAVMWEAAASHDFSPDGFEFQRHTPAPQYLRAEHRKRPLFKIESEDA